MQVSDLHDEHWIDRNIYRSEINTLKKCVKLFINKNCTEMHGQQNIKFRFYSSFVPFEASDIALSMVTRLRTGQMRKLDSLYGSNKRFFSSSKPLNR